nr:hypothetical protein BaRGS_025056 [Batillaria attramentaria]
MDGAKCKLIMDFLWIIKTLMVYRFSKIGQIRTATYFGSIAGICILPEKHATLDWQTSELDNGLDQTDNVSVSGGAIAELDTVINCGLIPALVVLGVIGNCLCVAVLVKQRYHSVAKPLLLALCVSGVLFLLCALLVVLSKIAARFDTESGRVLEVVMTPQVAVLRDVIGRVTVVMTLAIGVERSVTMTRHFKMKALCTVPRTRSVVLAVYIIVFALMAPLFFRYDVIEHRVLPDNVTRLKLRRTTFYLDNRIAMDFYTDFLLPAFLRLLPFVSMCVCFTVIVVSFKRRLQCRTGHQQTPRTGAFARARGGAGHENRDESAHADLALEERKLTRALLVVLLICILWYLQQTSELDNVLDQTDNVAVNGGAIAELDVVVEERAEL